MPAERKNLEKECALAYSYSRFRLNVPFKCIFTGTDLPGHHLHKDGDDHLAVWSKKRSGIHPHEVADIFYRYGDHYRQNNEQSSSLSRLKHSFTMCEKLYKK